MSYASRYQQAQNTSQLSGTSSTGTKYESPTMQRIRLQTLKRRQRFKKLEEKEKRQELKRREHALKERKQRLKNLDPRGEKKQQNSSKCRRRPSKYQPSRLVESLDLRSSIHDSTQMFQLAERLAKENDVTASKAVHIMHKKKSPLKKPQQKPPLSDNDSQQRLIGQKFKLEPIGTQNEQKKRQRYPSRRRRATGRYPPRNGGYSRSPSSIRTDPANHSNISETSSRYTSNLSEVSSNYDFEGDSILSAPSHISNGKRKARRSRPWRQKPTIPKRKDFETGYSVEISNVENSIANLDKKLNRKKKIINRAAREHVLWEKAEQERKKREREEQVNKENVVQNRIPHEDYSKYIPEDDPPQEDDIEEDVPDESMIQSPKQSPIASSKHEATPDHMSQTSNQSRHLTSRPRRANTSNIAQPHHIRRVPSQNTIKNIMGFQKGQQMQNSSRNHTPQHEFNTLQTLDRNQDTDSSSRRAQPIQMQSSPHADDASEHDLEPLSTTMSKQSTRSDSNSTLNRNTSRNLTSRGLTLRSRRTNRYTGLKKPSRVANYDLFSTSKNASTPKQTQRVTQFVPDEKHQMHDIRSPQKIQDYQTQVTQSPASNTSKRSFLNSVQMDDDIPEMPLMKRSSFGRRVQQSSQSHPTQTKTPKPKKAPKKASSKKKSDDAFEGGGEINVANSKALAFLGLS